MDDFRNVVREAANLKSKNGQEVSLQDFLTLYPCFENVNPEVLALMLQQANDTVLESRWHARWKLGVCLYAAHLLTLYLKTSVPEGADDAAVSAAGQSRGAVTSKSVGGISVSYGTSEATGDLVGYGSLKDTIYGQQFASMARLVGRGMMVVQ